MKMKLMALGLGTGGDRGGRPIKNSKRRRKSGSFNAHAEPENLRARHRAPEPAQLLTLTRNPGERYRKVWM
jgi:hypothetical protein